MTEPGTGRAREFALKVAGHRGWRLNPDAEHAEGVMAGLDANRERLGYYLCPCREGAGDRGRDADISCPCEYADADLEEYGHCYCGLFVTDAFVTRGATVESIPERRSALRERSGGPAPHGIGKDLCSIKEVVRTIHELEQELKRRYGLTLNEGLCLCCVSSVSRSPGDCARQLGLSPSRVSRLLNALERKGLLERRSLPDDHRSTDLVVTSAGMRRLGELRSGGFVFSRLDALAAAVEGRTQA